MPSASISISLMINDNDSFENLFRLYFVNKLSNLICEKVFAEVYGGDNF